MHEGCSGGVEIGLIPPFPVVFLLFREQRHMPKLSPVGGGGKDRYDTGMIFSNLLEL